MPADISVRQFLRGRALMRRRVVGSALAGMVAGATLLAPAGPARADDDVPCESVTSDQEQRVTTDNRSVPMDLMLVEKAHALFDQVDREPGAGVRVAVVDSGVFDSPLLSIVDRQIFSEKTTELSDYHGTAVAGLIAGDARKRGGVVGVAPGAEIVDVQVYDVDRDPDEDETTLTAELLVKGLDYVADNATSLGIGVVNVSLAVGRTEALDAVIKRLAKLDVVVVAAAGNRPGEEDPLWSEFGYNGVVPPPPGEDAAAAVWPAGYDSVVAVSATSDGSLEITDAATAVLRNSQIDVAAPTIGGVSIGIEGSSCLLNEIATSWATAEVSGVVALLRSAYRDDNARQIVARLVRSASGTPDPATGRGNVLTGAGVVQPMEALTRPLEPDKSGAVETNKVEDTGNIRAVAPIPEPDMLAEPRQDAVWWGLVGGGLLIVAVVLRPVLARRRR